MYGGHVLASDVGSLLSDLGNKLGGATLLIGIAVAAYVAWKRDDLKTVRENNADLLARVGILEADKAVAAADNARISAERDTALSENRTLRSIVTGEVKLTQIEDVLEEHHQQTLNWQKTANDKIDDLKRAVEEWLK